jgi:uncharacterized protein
MPLVLEKITQMLLPLVAGAVLVYLLIIAGAFLFQSRLVYFPERELAATPQVKGLSYQEVRFTAADEVELHGWFIPAAPARGVILFCHGNAGNISHRLESIQLFHQLGMSTFIFDYRGYGRSQGRPSEAGTYRDAEAAWRYLLNGQNIPASRIVLFGRSLGGAVAAWLAQYITPAGLILESTFTSIPDLGAEVYPFLPVRRMSRFHYNTGDYVGRVHCPLLIVHSRDDEMISVAHGRRLFNAAGEPKEWLEIRGSHNDGFLTSGAHYRNGLEVFLGKYLQDYR